MIGIIAKGLLIPFLGTSLGSAMVFFMKKELDVRVQKILSGFAAGVMIAASVWSLLIPSMEMAADRGRFAFVPAAVGFVAVYVESAAVLTLYLYVTLLIPFSPIVGSRFIGWTL